MCQWSELGLATALASHAEPELEWPVAVPSLLAYQQQRSGLHVHPTTVGCQNITAKNQSLREERSSTGTQHSNSLFKYQVGTSTPMSEQEPRHMGALQYRLDCQEADI